MIIRCATMLNSDCLGASGVGRVDLTGVLHGPKDKEGMIVLYRVD